MPQTKQFQIHVLCLLSEEDWRENLGRDRPGKWEAELPFLDLDTVEERKMEVKAQPTHCLVLVLSVICFTIWQ